jgi:hypothetical protein
MDGYRPALDECRHGSALGASLDVAILACMALDGVRGLFVAVGGQVAFCQHVSGGGRQVSLPDISSSSVIGVVERCRIMGKRDEGNRKFNFPCTDTWLCPFLQVA